MKCRRECACQENKMPLGGRSWGPPMHQVSGRIRPHGKGIEDPLSRAAQLQDMREER